jgi:hypothetical protein
MKTTTSAIISVSILLATAAAAPSSFATYKLKIDSENPKIKDVTLVVKDESAANTFPNPLGSFSTGEPRYPYTFTISTLSESDKLYEFKGTVRQTHLILNGDSRAPQLFDVPIGADPIPTSDGMITRNKFLIEDDAGTMSVSSAEDKRGGSGTFHGPGTWRACTSGTIDYQLYWFDGKSILSYWHGKLAYYRNIGRSNLTAIIEGCESVSLLLEEVDCNASTIVVPAPTATGSGFITGVPAPTGNSTRTGATVSPTSFPGAASRLGMTSTLMGLAVGVMAFFL